MAVIHDKIVIEDGFSTQLDRFAEKCNTSVNALNKMKYSAEDSFNAWMSNLDKPLEERAQLAFEAGYRMEAALQSQSAAEVQVAAAAEQEAVAQEKAADAAEESTKSHDRLIRSLKALGLILASPFIAPVKLVQGIKKVSEAIAGVHTPLDGLATRLRRTALMMFSARRVITYIKNALKRAPAEMSAGLETLTTMVKDGFDRTVLSIVRGFLPAVDKLKQAFTENTNIGKAFGQALELIGNAVGFLIEKIAQLVNWMGNNLETVLTAAAILLGLVAVKLVAVGVAAVFANWKLIALVAFVGAFASAFVSAGGTAESAIQRVGEVFGWLYATIYNAAAAIWDNALAPLAEGFATFLTSPLHTAEHIFLAFVYSVLSGLSAIASALDSLFGAVGINLNAQAFVDAARSKVGAAMDEFATSGTAGRMGKLDPKETAKAWGEKASGIASKFTELNLEKYQLTELQDINANTGATAKAVDMAAEDLKSFVDMAERDYVMRVNLQTPTINITGQNTGNTKEDAEALANRIAGVLADMRASSPSVPVDYLYSGSVG